MQYARRREGRLAEHLRVCASAASAAVRAGIALMAGRACALCAPPGHGQVLRQGRLCNNRCWRGPQDAKKLTRCKLTLAAMCCL